MARQGLSSWSLWRLLATLMPTWQVRRPWWVCSLIGGLQSVREVPACNSVRVCRHWHSSAAPQLLRGFDAAVCMCVCVCWLVLLCCSRQEPGAGEQWVGGRPSVLPGMRNAALWQRGVHRWLAGPRQLPSAAAVQSSTLQLAGLTADVVHPRCAVLCFAVLCCAVMQGPDLGSMCFGGCGVSRRLHLCW